MGGAIAADLEGTGRPDVVATSEDGHVYALRGKTSNKEGELLWKSESDDCPSFSPATAADLDGNGQLQILVTTTTGRLHVLDGKDGKELWSPDISGTTEVAGRAVVVKAAGRTLILAPLGDAGLVAFDWASRRELWRSPPNLPVIASPVTADLAGDGKTDVVVGTITGEVLVLNLADGQVLWGSKVAGGSIEGDPVVADLDGDGIPDIVIASHDFYLYAIDGRKLREVLRAGGQVPSVNRH